MSFGDMPFNVQGRQKRGAIRYFIVDLRSRSKR